VTDAPHPIEAVRAMLLDLLGGPDATIEHRRRQSEVFSASLPPLAPDILVTPDRLGGIPVERVRFTGAPARSIFLHLHGGGYVMGDPAGSRSFTTALARAAGCEVVSVDYRLAPTHPFPAAVEDAVGVYAALLAAGVPAGSIAIGGESAGGGLAVAALLAARDRGLPMPACAIALSPWVNLACEGESYVSRHGRDPLLCRAVLQDMADEYLSGADPRQALASPSLANLTGLPPLLIQVGSEEVLLDDAQTLADQAREAGVEVDLQIWVDMIHVWQMFPGVLAEADRAIEAIALMLRRKLTVLLA
jgi:epsilon-lactone hydrolase